MTTTDRGTSLITRGQRQALDTGRILHGSAGISQPTRFMTTSGDSTMTTTLTTIRSSRSSRSSTARRSFADVLSAPLLHLALLTRDEITRRQVLFYAAANQPHNAVPLLEHAPSLGHFSPADADTLVASLFRAYLGLRSERGAHYTPLVFANTH